MRQLDPTFSAALEAGTIMPGILADLTFKSGVEYVWTGFGSITWNGNTYRGVGTLAGVGDVKEGIAVRADGTSVSLDGIDAKLYAECMTEIQVGAPAKLWFALLSQVDGASTSAQTGPVQINELTWNEDAQSGQILFASSTAYVEGDVVQLAVQTATSINADEAAQATQFSGSSVTLHAILSNTETFTFTPLSTLSIPSCQDYVTGTASPASGGARIVVDACPLFSGLIDKPTVSSGADKISLTLALETRMTNLQRASNRRLSSADQRIDYPTDTGLGWEPTLQDQAFYAGVR